MTKRHTTGKSRSAPASFESVYVRYPFAELVRLGIGAASWFCHLRMHIGRRLDIIRRENRYPGSMAANQEHGRLVMKRVHHWHHLRHRPTGQTK